MGRNPLRGFRTPKEKNPKRVTLTCDEYVALLRVAAEVDWRFRVMLILAHETGHRIGAIRQLRWSDIDMDDCHIRWRAATEKNGYEHVTPITQDARDALLEALRRTDGVGESWVLPAPKAAEGPVSRSRARTWWKKAEKLAGLEPRPWRGWHSLRRKFASDLMEKPLKVLCNLGGWKSPETVLQCYQHPDQARLRSALESRGRGADSAPN